MAEPEAFVAFMREMGAQIAGLSTTVGAQGVAKVVKPFDGDGKHFNLRTGQKYFSEEIRGQFNPIKINALTTSKY